MPRLRKAIFHNQVHFITMSVEEGIMLPANPLVKFLIKAALVRAYKHHALEINHLIVNGTHIHMIVRIEDPEELPKFMERFKTESAHYLNRILGRQKRTIWCERYDSPSLPRINDVIKKIIYLYTNPVKDRLIESISKYPGISTWSHFKSNLGILKSNYVSRDSLFPVDQTLGEVSFEKIKTLLAKNNPRLGQIQFNPSGWLKAFGITEQAEIDEINKEIFNSIKNEEKEIQQEKESFMGRAKLENQGIDLAYIPKRSGRKMWVHCGDKKLRISIITYIKDLCEEADEIYKRIKNGDFSTFYPAGLYPPRLPVLHNLVEHLHLY